MDPLPSVNTTSGLTSNSSNVQRPAKLQLQVDTLTTSRASTFSKGLDMLKAQEEGYLRPITSPPDSPTRSRLFTMTEGFHIRHDSAVITPPPTPTNHSHSKSSSRSSIPFSSLSSTSNLLHKPSTDVSEKPVSTELKVFEHWATDYDMSTKKLLGSGLWSDVYLVEAKPIAPTPFSNPQIGFTPPITPVKLHKSSLSKDQPTAYAIKYPASKDAKKVLGDEAKILSYLSRFQGTEKCVVQFHGQDPRNESLVLKVMDSTLESWTTDLNKLSEAERSQKPELFPGLAIRLVEGLCWMKERGVVHADIKPANILLSVDPTTKEILEVVYSDFSSATLFSSSTPDSTTLAPLGGGTWDFLDPQLLSVRDPVSPSYASDLWALAMTLLVTVIGGSPFDCMGSNVFRRRDIIKSGTPVAYIGYGDDALRNIKRLKNLSRDLGWDFKKWFEGVLRKDASKRVSLEAWREELEGFVRQ